MAAPEHAHLQVSYDGREWKVELNGRDIANMLAPGGLKVVANDNDMIGPTAVLTFADVELDVDLKNVLIEASKKAF